MALLSSVGDFFALDIGTTAIRLVHLRGGSTNKTLVKYGSISIDAKIAQSEALEDQRKLADAIRKLIADVGVGTKNVVIGLPSHAVFSSVVDMPKLKADELDKTIRYQADQHLPMALDEVQMDWALLGDSPKDPTKVEVLLTSVAKGTAERHMDLVESLGLNVIAIEPDALALSRALTPAGEQKGAVMLLDMGDRTTDLVITMGSGPRLIRGIQTGGSSFIKAATQNLNIDEKQAQQFVYKFGLNKDKLEGQVFNALQNTVDQLLSEVDKSIKFFNGRYEGVAIERIIVSGGASTLPEFPLYLANKTGIRVEIGNAWQNVSYPNNLYNDLIAVSNHFGVAVGLAGRS